MAKLSIDLTTLYCCQIMNFVLLIINDMTKFDFIQEATRAHRLMHGCGAYTFEDGSGLISLVRQLKSLRVLELGTALGYTACCLSSASSETTVDTIEHDPQHVALARKNITEAQLSDRIKVHEGTFESIIKTLPVIYDLAFFDGFAPDLSTIEKIRQLLTDDGVLICANLIYADLNLKEALSNDFEQGSKWIHIASLENGGTQVYRKAAIH